MSCDLLLGACDGAGWGDRGCFSPAPLVLVEEGREGGGCEGGDLGEECPEDEEEGLWGCGRCFGDDWCSLL